MIKTLILNKDVGCVSPGMKVTKQGEQLHCPEIRNLSSRLLPVSRDSIKDKNPGLVYRTYVHSEKKQVMVEGVETPVRPG